MPQRAQKLSERWLAFGYASYFERDYYSAVQEHAYWLREHDMSLRQIGRRLGVSQETVRRYLWKHIRKHRIPIRVM